MSLTTSRARVCARAGRLRRARSGRLMAERLRGKGQFAYLARQVSPDEARAGQGAQDLHGVAVLQGKPPLLPEEGAGGARSRLRRPGQRRPRADSSRRSTSRSGDMRASMLVQTDARRRAMCEPRRASGDSRRRRSSSPSTSTCSTSSNASCGPASPKTRAAGGTAVILNPQTGEILAHGELADLQPERVQRVADVDARRNRAIQDSYEPGSTFKVVTASAAIEERADRPDDPIDCSPGYITFGGRKSSAIPTTTACCRSSTSSPSRATSGRSRSA